MRRFKRVFLAMIVLIFVFLVLAFVLENQQSASLSFFGWSTIELPVSVFVTLSLVLGLIVGPLFGLLASRRKSARKA